MSVHRSPPTRDLDRLYRAELKDENERQIATLINGREQTLLAAWGALVTSRPYLPALLRDILELTSRAGCLWVSLGDSTEDGHPRHPSRLAAETPLVPFDMGSYLHDLA